MHTGTYLDTEKPQPLNLLLKELEIPFEHVPDYRGKQTELHGKHELYFSSLPFCSAYLKKRQGEKEEELILQLLGSHQPLSEDDKRNLTIRRLPGTAWQIFSSENLLERDVKVNMQGFTVTKGKHGIAITGGDKLGRLLMASAATMGEDFIELENTFKATFDVDPSKDELRITFNSITSFRGDVLMPLMVSAFDRMQKLGTSKHLINFNAIDVDADQLNRLKELLAAPCDSSVAPDPSSARSSDALIALQGIVEGLKKLQSKDTTKSSQKTICDEALRKIEAFIAGEADVHSIRDFFSVFINRKFFGSDGFLGYGEAGKPTEAGKLAREMEELFVTKSELLLIVKPNAARNPSPN